MDWSWLLGTQKNESTELCVRAQVGHIRDQEETIQMLRHSLANRAHISQSPPPRVSVAGYNLSGVVLNVVASCLKHDYWQAFLETTQAVDEIEGAHFWPADGRHDRSSTNKKDPKL